MFFFFSVVLFLPFRLLFSVQKEPAYGCSVHIYLFLIFLLIKQKILIVWKQQKDCLLNEILLYRFFFFLQNNDFLSFIWHKVEHRQIPSFIFEEKNRILCCLHIKNLKCMCFFLRLLLNKTFKPHLYLSFHVFSSLFLSFFYLMSFVFSCFSCMFFFIPFCCVVLNFFKINRLAMCIKAICALVLHIVIYLFFLHYILSFVCYFFCLGLSFFAHFNN